jgi:tetratricopeptide (TPR) repeat protein
VAVALIILLLRQGELRHMWEERLKRLLHPASARIWAWALLGLPFLMGMGVGLAAAVLMGLLWPVLRPRERVVHGMLLAALLVAPFSGQLIGWMAAPMRADRAPLFGLAGLHDEAWSAERHAQVAALAKAHPEDPLAQFALGWSARLGGDLATAETAYRQALAGWPEEPRVLNNLANVLAVRGEFGPAAELYRRSFAADPKNAAAYFNLSQVLTRQFDFQNASDAVNHASAIDFELVKNYQAMSTDDGVLPLADQWIDAPTLWKRVLATTPGQTTPVLPFAWRGHVETSGLPFAAAVVVLGLGSVVLGVFWQKGMPLRHCRNCGAVVCRRCVRHRREVALCPSCAGQESRAESREFTELLLARVRGQVTRKRRVVRTVLAVLVPGYGMLVHHQVISATLALVSLASLTAPWIGAGSPFTYQTHIGPSDWTAMAGATAAICVLIHLTSLIGFVAGNRREAAAAVARAPRRSAAVHAGASGRKEGGLMALQGNLRDFSVSEILQLLGTQRKTGCLRLKRDKESYVVFVADGRVVSAREPGMRMDDPLLRLLIKVRRLSDEQQQGLAALHQDSGRDLEDLLLNGKYLEQDDLAACVERQILDTLSVLSHWDTGSYEFDPGSTWKSAKLVKMNAEGALIEAARRLDEGKRQAAMFGDGHQLVGVRDLPDPDEPLSDEEREMFGLVDGQHT